MSDRKKGLRTSNRSASVAVTDEGEVWSFGAGGRGQLGHGDYESRHVPCRIGVCMRHARILFYAPVSDTLGETLARARCLSFSHFKVKYGINFQLARINPHGSASISPACKFHPSVLAMQ